MQGGGPQTLHGVLARFLPGRHHSRSQNHAFGSAPGTGDLGDGDRSHCLSMRNRNLTMVYIFLFVLETQVVAISCVDFLSCLLGEQRAAVLSICCSCATD